MHTNLYSITQCNIYFYASFLLGIGSHVCGRGKCLTLYMPCICRVFALPTSFRGFVKGVIGGLYRRIVQADCKAWVNR